MGKNLMHLRKNYWQEVFKDHVNATILNHSKHLSCPLETVILDRWLKGSNHQKFFSVLTFLVELPSTYYSWKKTGYMVKSWPVSEDSIQHFPTPLENDKNIQVLSTFVFCIITDNRPILSVFEIFKKKAK